MIHQQKTQQQKAIVSHLYAVVLCGFALYGFKVDLFCLDIVIKFNL